MDVPRRLYKRHGLTTKLKKAKIVLSWIKDDGFGRSSSNEVVNRTNRWTHVCALCAIRGKVRTSCRDNASHERGKRSAREHYVCDERGRGFINYDTRYCFGF